MKERNEMKLLGKWVNVGRWQDFLNGEREIIIYANTIDMVWRVGIIIPQHDKKEEKK